MDDGARHSLHGFHDDEETRHITAPRMTRYVTKNSIPSTPMMCWYVDRCVYGKEGGGVCQDPRTNRGNSDAICHGVRPKMVMLWLSESNDIRDGDR